MSRRSPRRRCSACSVSRRCSRKIVTRVSFRAAAWRSPLGCGPGSSVRRRTGHAMLAVRRSSTPAQRLDDLVVIVAAPADDRLGHARQPRATGQPPELADVRQGEAELGFPSWRPAAQPASSASQPFSHSLRRSRLSLTEPSNTGSRSAKSIRCLRRFANRLRSSHSSSMRGCAMPSPRTARGRSACAGSRRCRRRSRTAWRRAADDRSDSR